MAVSTHSCVLTVVPGGIVPVAGATPRFRFSVHVAPRLVPAPSENALSYFPPFAAWPTQAPNFDRIEVVGLGGAGPVASVPAIRISADPDAGLWAALFLPTMLVVPFDETAFENKFGGSKVRSYPALALHEWQRAFLGDRVIQNEVNAPTPADLAAVLGALTELNGDGRAKEVAAEIEAAYPAGGSQATRFARYLPTGPARPFYGSALQTLADHLQLLTFLAPRASAAYLAANPSISPPQIDFHRALALLADHPALLRMLGLVVDYECDLQPTDSTNKFIDATSVQLSPQGWSNITPSGGFMYPQTRIDPSTFLALPRQDGLLTTSRMLNLESEYGSQNPGGWGVVSLDVEGTAVKTLNLGNTVRNADALPVGSSSRPDALDTAAPRSGGLSLMKGDRAKDTWSGFRHTADHLATDPNSVMLYLDDLVRGYRVDVFDTSENSTTASWRSLMQRDIIYTPSLWTQKIYAPDDHTASPGPVPSLEPPVYSNEGVISTVVTASPDPASDDDKFVAEGLFEWTGWSFVAPRPGGALADGGSRPVANPEPTNTEMSLTIDVEATPGSLPRLRYGHSYRFRVRSADIAGCGPSLDDGLRDETAGYPSAPQPYVRWEPVPPPVLAQQDPLTTGETLTNLVVRSRDQATDVAGVVRSARHVLPPSATAGTVELHGVLDALTPTDAYGLLLRRDGYRLSVGASPDWITPSYTGEADPRSDPADRVPFFREGSHPVVPPWLVDPMSSGFRLGGPGLLEKILDFAPLNDGEWMNSRGWRLELAPLATGTDVTFTANADKRTLIVGIPKGEQFTMPLSSTVTESMLGHMSATMFIEEHAAAIVDPAARLADRLSRTNRMRNGRNRQVSPPTAVTFVHAVQVPLLEPSVQPGSLSVLRTPGGTTADLGGVLRVHRKSTGRVDIDLAWDDPRDVGPGGPSQTPGNAVLEPVEVVYPATPSGTTVQGFANVTQEFGDTKHRLVSVGVTATSRYAEYFARRRNSFPMTTTAASLLKPGDEGIQEFSERVVERATGRVLVRGTHYLIDYAAGTIRSKPLLGNAVVQIRFVPLPLTTATRPANRRSVHVPSTARPAPPVVHDVIPVFDDTPWVDYPPPPKTSGRRRTRDGRTLRVYFERPWFSSGADEMIAVVLQRSDRVTDGQYTGVVHPNRAGGTPRPPGQRLTSAWGRDPLVVGDPVARNLTVSSFPLAAEGAAFSKWEISFSLPGVEAPVIVVPHAVEYDAASGLWYSDISLALGHAYRPFVRLALARFQPYSLAGYELSEIVTIDAAQLSPTRTVTVSGSGATRTVTLSGPAYTEATTGVPPTLLFFNRAAADTTVHRKPAPVVEVQVQQRVIGGTYDSGDPNVGWFDVVGRTYTLALNPVPLANGDQRFSASGIDVTVSAGWESRLVIREFEVDTRPVGAGGHRRRLAFLDTYRV